MKLLTFTVFICLLLIICSGCETGQSNEKQPFVTNSSSVRQANTNAPPVNSNINGNTEKLESMSVTTQNNLNAAAPAIFNISEADIETAFAEGENLFRNKSGGNPPIFGTENKVEFRLQQQAKLVLSIAFKTPRDESKERGYGFAKQGAKADERAGVLSLTKKLVTQHSKQVNFQVVVKEWSGGENTPNVRFTLTDADGNPIKPNSNPQLDFCVGKDILRPCTTSPLTFPLFQGEKPLLTDTMESLTLAISVDDTGNETSFRLR